MTFVLSDELRAQIRAELKQAGVSDSDIPLVIDLALHCVTEAGAALIRVTSALPWHLQPTALALASGLLHLVTEPQMTLEQITREKWAMRAAGQWHPGDEVD